MKTNNYFLVFLGGGLGALLRYLIASVLELTIGHDITGSLYLFIVNIAGAVFLGLVAAMKTESQRILTCLKIRNHYRLMLKQLELPAIFNLT
ncbi:MAG: hypothetical protein EBT82_04305 [Micrococcales bacterium]|nr:hypothetical protein [Micrococcales bacterium]